MHLTAGKFRGFQRLSDDRGLFKMVAIDQRNPILEPIKRIRGTAEAPYEDVVAVKDLLARFLAPGSSAMLLDPLFSFPYALPLIGSRPGLILAYENAALERTPDGIKSSPIPGWSIAKTRLAGADAAKLLIWYRADAPEPIRAHQQALVKATGEACRQNDLVFLVEILVYQLPSEDRRAFEQGRPRFVQAAVSDFLDPVFGIDIYKLEPPSSLSDVPDPNGREAKGTQDLFDRLADGLPRPWVLLSAGAAPEDFHHSLVFAYRAGASGYLCGRAIWKRAFDQFPNTEAMADVLQGESIPYLDAINALSDRMAAPWQSHPGWQGKITIADESAEFPKRYADDWHKDFPIDKETLAARRT